MSEHACRLIEITEDAEQQILYIARVSSNQDNTDVGLLRYLIKHKHWSPFEMASATFEFETTLPVATELLRHKSMSFQQFSQRYAPVTEFILNPGRRQADHNRQSSTDDLDADTQKWWLETQGELYRHVLGVYNEALSRGIARECARDVLMQATKTKIYVHGTIRSWIHFFGVRCHPDAMLEIRELAEIARSSIGGKMPVIAEALAWEAV